MHGRVKSEIVILEILTVHVNKCTSMWKFDFKYKTGIMSRHKRNKPFHVHDWACLKVKI